MLKKKNWIWIIVLIVIVLFFLKPETFKFAAGGCEAKSNKVVFRTNAVDEWYPGGEYWISYDVDNDGNLDALGWRGSYNGCPPSGWGDDYEKLSFKTPSGTGGEYDVYLRPVSSSSYEIGICKKSTSFLVYRTGNYKPSKDAVTISTPVEPYTSNCQELYDESGGDGNGNGEYCTDTDGGKDYYTFGRVDTKTGGRYDCCKESADGGGACKNEAPYLVEAYCDGNEAKFEVYKCPYGCKDSAYSGGKRDAACIKEDTDQNTEADTNEDGCASFNEFTTYANKWVDGDKTFDQFIEVANVWVSQEGCY